MQQPNLLQVGEKIFAQKTKTVIDNIFRNASNQQHE